MKPPSLFPTSYHDAVSCDACATLESLKYTREVSIIDNQVKFPKGEFTAFSTAKMSHFLPVSEELTRDDIVHFFKDDARWVALTPIPSVELHIPHSEAQIAHPGQLIARFNNGKYKVMDRNYYLQNFNAPLLDAQDEGIV